MIKVKGEEELIAWYESRVALFAARTKEAAAKAAWVVSKEELKIASAAEDAAWDDWRPTGSAEDDYSAKDD